MTHEVTSHNTKGNHLQNDSVIPSLTGKACLLTLDPSHDSNSSIHYLVEEVIEVGHGVDVLLREAHAPQVARGRRGQRGQSGHGLVEARVGGAPEMVATFI